MARNSILLDKSPSPGPVAQISTVTVLAHRLLLATEGRHGLKWLGQG